MRARTALIVPLFLAACAAPVTSTPAAEAPGTTPTPLVEPVTPPAGSPPTTSVSPAPTGLRQGEWRQLASMPTPRSEMPAAVLNGRIYVPGGFPPQNGGTVVGGETAFEAYDPGADAWQTLAPLPEGRHHLMAAAHPNTARVYVFGGAGAPGWAPTSTAWAYDPESDAWSSLAPMPEARLAGAAVTLGNHLYVVGGAGGTQALLRYSPATDSWASLAPLKQAREHTAAVALDGKIYALAGRWTGVGELTSVEVYDPATDSWSDAAPLNVARGGHGAAVLAGQAFVVGGEVIVHGRDTLESVEALDPQSGSWSFAPPMPVTLHGVPAAAVGDTLYVLGGSDRAAAAENEGRVLAYRP